VVTSEQRGLYPFPECISFYCRYQRKLLRSLKAKKQPLHALKFTRKQGESNLQELHSALERMFTRKGITRQEIVDPGENDEA
jgi:hypothetical protein